MFRVLTLALILGIHSLAAAHPELTSHADGDVVAGVETVVVTIHPEPNWFAQRTIFRTRSLDTSEIIRHCKVRNVDYQNPVHEFTCDIDFGALEPGEYVLTAKTVLYGYGIARDDPQVVVKNKARITVGVCEGDCD